MAVSSVWRLRGVVTVLLDIKVGHLLADHIWAYRHPVLSCQKGMERNDLEMEMKMKNRKLNLNGNGSESVNENENVKENVNVNVNVNVNDRGQQSIDGIGVQCPTSQLYDTAAMLRGFDPPIFIQKKGLTTPIIDTWIENNLKFRSGIVTPDNVRLWIDPSRHCLPGSPKPLTARGVPSLILLLTNTTAYYGPMFLEWYYALHLGKFEQLFANEETSLAVANQNFLRSFLDLCSGKESCGA